MQSPREPPSPPAPLPRAGEGRHDYARFTAELRHLAQALAALAPQGAEVGVPPPAGQEWFELLCNKLLPNLTCRRCWSWPSSAVRISASR